MKRQNLFFLWALLVSQLLCLTLPVSADIIPDDYQAVLSYLGRAGDFKDKVLKVNIPRNDLEITVAGTSVPTAFGFGGWIGMTKGRDGREVLMGDLVLREDEVNPVLSALLANGLEVTALHNHFFWEQPRIFFMHMHGSGDALALAKQVKPALDLIGHPAHPAVAPQERRGAEAGGGKGSGVSNLSFVPTRIDQIVGHPGEQLGPVYKITVGRADLHVEEMGAPINARMGLNSWAAFFGNERDAVVAGDIAMLDSELTPVLKALHKNGLQIVAIHNHMMRTQPVIYFLHYWGHGPVEKLAAGFRAALDELGSTKAGHANMQ